MTGALALDPSVFGSDGIQSELGLECIGNETTVLDCSVTHYNHPMMCSPFLQAAVLCQGMCTYTMATIVIKNSSNYRKAHSLMCV